MVGSIDPRCETVRGIHWPKKGREVVWSTRRGNHLGQRPKATASTGRTYGCKRSDQTLKKLLWHGGRPHMGPRFRALSRGRRRELQPPQRHGLNHMVRALLQDQRRARSGRQNIFLEIGEVGPLPDRERGCSRFLVRKRSIA